MRLFFNTTAINYVGLKIYFDGRLKKECIIRGGIYPAFVEVEGTPKNIVLELCYEKELENPIEVDTYLKEFNSKVYGSVGDETYVSTRGAFKTQQFAYLTEIEYIGVAPKDEYFYFANIGVGQQCAVFVKDDTEIHTKDKKREILYKRRYSYGKMLLPIVAKIAIGISLLTIITVLFFIYLNRFFVGWSLAYSRGLSRICMVIFAFIVMMPFIYVKVHIMDLKFIKKDVITLEELIKYGDRDIFK